MILREEGAGGLRADRLARRLGLTKGSFHHHFDGMPGYRRALLELCRQREAGVIAAVRAGIVSLAPAEAIAALPDRLDGLFDMRLDAALRGWAIGDDEARTALAAIDAARLEMLEGLWARVLPDPSAARAAALVPYLVTVGASMSAGVSEDDLRAVYRLLSHAVPGVAG